MHSTLPGSCKLQERPKLNCAAPGRPQDSVPPSPVSPTSLPALDLGEKEESSRIAERERRAGWDLNTTKAQLLGLSTATLGWSRCLQRTQSLFFIFSFFPFFFPLNLSIGCGGGRRISKPFSSAGWLMHHCCNAVLEMVTELECLCPLPRVLLGWQRPCRDRCCPGAPSSRTAPCFSRPKQEG